MSNELKIILDTTFYILMSIIVSLVLNIFFFNKNNKVNKNKKKVNEESLKELLSYLVKEGYTFNIKKINFSTDELEYITIEIKKLQEAKLKETKEITIEKSNNVIKDFLEKENIEKE